MCFGVERNKSLIKLNSKDLSRIQENIKIIENNINELNKKSSELSMKKKDFNETLETVAYDNNSVTRSYFKSEGYLNEIAFCDLFLYNLNDRSIQK